MIRKSFSVLAFVALSAPIAAHAGGPSGEYWEIFAKQPSVEVTAEQNGRNENPLYVEFPVHQFSGESTLTVKQVREEIASAPLPIVGA